MLGVEEFKRIDDCNGACGFHRAVGWVEGVVECIGDMVECCRKGAGYEKSVLLVVVMVTDNQIGSATEGVRHASHLQYDVGRV